MGYCRYSPADEKYMRIALGLAEKTRGMTSPNPMVGAVIVKNGRIIGRGYHKRAGSAHAEVNALKAAGKKAKGATLYVTLEPCCFFGRTPPCTDAIIKAGIKKVVIAAKDPNPLNNGRGTRILRRHNIIVKPAVCRDAAVRLNEVFNKYITAKMPFVILKMAQTLDGKIASRTGESKWISCGKSRRFVHGLRREVDAVMIGANTALKDNPQLARGKIKIVVGVRTKAALGKRIFSGGAPVITASGRGGRVNLKRFLKALARQEVTSVLCEGGGELAWSLLKDGLVDKALFFIAPKIIGGRNAKTSVEGDGVSRVSRAFMLKDVSARKIGSDLLIEAKPCLPV